MNSWIHIPEHSDFTLHNIPFGVYRSLPYGEEAACTRIGDTLIDLNKLLQSGYLEAWQEKHHVLDDIFALPYLNSFIELGREATSDLRKRLVELFSEADDSLQDDEEAQEGMLWEADKMVMSMPVFVRDYTDFYSSEEHATNVGVMFRGKENALMPNWKHLPVGYHGRASSIVVSGTPIHRPNGQTRPNDNEPPVFGKSKQLDFELEMAFVIGKQTAMGESVSTEVAESYIFGMLIFNDWSARDIQKWEYVPLGPFLGKNFGSSVSPWIVTMEALQPFKVAGPVQSPEVLSYLQYKGEKNYDINLEVAIQPENSEEVVVCRSNHKYLYWNMAQQLAHHTVNGCNLNVGDLMASGTISGPAEDSFGSMLELAWKGTKPLQMPDGTTRTFLQDGDTCIMRAYCEKDGIRVGFGEVSGKIVG